MGAKPARPDEEDNAIFHGGEPARSTAIVFRGRLWQTGQEIGISVGAALAVLEGVVGRGEKFESPLESRIVVSHFADAFERRATRNDANLRAPEVASKVFDGPNNAATFQVEWSPVPLEIEGNAADVIDGPHGAVRLLLFKRSTKTVDARVAVRVEGAGAVGHGVPVRKDQNWWSGKLGENFAHDKLHGGRELKLDSLPE